MSLLRKYTEDFINYGEPTFFKKEDIFKIREEELREVCKKRRVNINIHYLLFTNLINLQKLNYDKEAAYVAYLLSYLISSVSEPPCSKYLSNHFIELAQSLDSENELYKNFQKVLDKVR